MLSTLLRLSPREAACCLLLLPSLPALSATIRVAGLARVLCWLGMEIRTDVATEPADRCGPQPAAVQRDLARRTGRSVARMGDRLGTSCLVQSIAALWLLARHEVPASVLIGTRLAGDTFSAHAWTRVGDEIVVGANGRERFSRITIIVPRGVFAVADREADGTQ